MAGAGAYARLMQPLSLGFRTDMALRVAEGGVVVDRGEYLVVRSPAQPEFWWGNFLLVPGAALHTDPAGWLDRFTAEFPAARHVAIGVDAAGADFRPPAALLAAGIEAEHSTVLTATALTVPPRPGVPAECRPLSGDEDWRQSLELRLACSEPGEPGGEREFCEQRVAARRRLTEAGHGTWFGAFRDGQLLAQLGLFDAGGGLARYQDVETHPAARRQGLASALLARTGQYGADVLAARTLVIVADPGAPAIRLYRSLGFGGTETQHALVRPPR